MCQVIRCQVSGDQVIGHQVTRCQMTRSPEVTRCQVSCEVSGDQVSGAAPGVMGLASLLTSQMWISESLAPEARRFAWGTVVYSAHCNNHILLFIQGVPLKSTPHKFSKSPVLDKI